MSSFFIKIGKLTASQTMTLANSVIAGLTANVGIYATPFPTVISLTTAATALQTAIIQRGFRSTPGGTSKTEQLKIAKATLYGMLIQVSQYCMNTTPNDRLSFLLAGFPTYFIHAAGFKAKNTQQAARNLRALVKRNVSATDVYLKWKKPLGHANGTAIKTWKVYRGLLPSLSTMTLVVTVTKTQYMDTPYPAVGTITSGTPLFYRVVGFNADGNSVSSDLTKITYISPT